MYYVGIDGGGTKCEIVVCDKEANIVGYCLSSLNDKPKKEREQFLTNIGGYGRNNQVIKNAFCEAIKDLDKNQKFNIIINVGTFLKEKLDIVNYEIKLIAEYITYLYATNIDQVYLVLSGTGAFVTYYNKGEELYFDGLGPGLGDYGGGYEIGLKGIRAAAISEWDPEYETSIAKAINKKLNNKDTNRYGSNLVEHFLNFKGRSDIASFAKIVNEEAEKGDKIGINILKESGRNLGNTVRCLVKNVRPNKGNFPLVCDGSVIRKSKIYREAFIEYCKENVPDNPIIFSDMPQALGCIMGCVREDKSINKDEFYNKLKTNYENYVK